MNNIKNARSIEECDFISKKKKSNKKKKHKPMKVFFEFLK